MPDNEEQTPITVSIEIKVQAAYTEEVKQLLTDATHDRNYDRLKEYLRKHLALPEKSVIPDINVTLQREVNIIPPLQTEVFVTFTLVCSQKELTRWLHASSHTAPPATWVLLSVGCLCTVENRNNKEPEVIDLPRYRRVRLPEEYEEEGERAI
jgi:hypothetical protein